MNRCRYLSARKIYTLKNDHFLFQTLNKCVQRIGKKIKCYKKNMSWLSVIDERKDWIKKKEIAVCFYRVHSCRRHKCLSIDCLVDCRKQKINSKFFLICIHAINATAHKNILHKEHLFASCKFTETCILSWGIFYFFKSLNPRWLHKATESRISEKTFLFFFE